MRVIGDDAESRVGGVFLHDPSKGHLCCCRHRVGFIEHDQFERCESLAVSRLRRRGEDLLGAWYRVKTEPLPVLTTGSSLTREGLDLLSHNVYPSIITCVQLQHHLSHVPGSVDFPRQRKDRRCLSGSGRTVEK